MLNHEPLNSTALAGDRSKADAVDHAVVLENVTKSYGENVVLDGVNVSFPRGEAAVVIGPSGCGKSSLLRCVNGLEKIQSGSISVNGLDVETAKPTELRRQVGMVFQQFSLFPHLTVMANLTLAPRRALGMARDEAEERAFQLLKRVGLEQKTTAHPRELSGGQSQRVAIARSLMMEPSIMLFDEVTSALDPELVGEVLQVMRDLADSGMTMLIVTHEMSFAREVGDRLIFMESGTILEDGDPASVLSNPDHARTRQFLKRILH